MDGETNGCVQHNIKLKLIAPLLIKRDIANILYSELILEIFNCWYMHSGCSKLFLYTEKNKLEEVYR